MPKQPVEEPTEVEKVQALLEPLKEHQVLAAGDIRAGQEVTLYAKDVSGRYDGTHVRVIADAREKDDPLSHLRFLVTRFESGRREARRYASDEQSYPLGAVVVPLAVVEALIKEVETARKAQKALAEWQAKNG